MKLTFPLGVVAFVVTACGSGQVQQSGAPEPRRRGIQDLPDWITNPPKDGAVVYHSSGEGESRDLSTAVSIAEADARTRAAASMLAEFRPLEDRFQVAIRGETDGETAVTALRQTVRDLTTQTLLFSRISQRKVTTSSNGVSYHAFILMESDKGTAKQALMDRIKADASLFPRFRATPAFSDLDADIHKIDEARKAVPPPQPASFLSLADRSLSAGK